MYNHKSLSNFKLSNKSDTDSISYSLSMNGVEDTIRKLNGMFALAIYELEKSILYLAVDRFGQKPLFYSLQNDLVRFGSIASTVTSYNSIQNLEKQQLSRYLDCGFIGPDCSIYKDVYRVPANCVVTVNTENNEVNLSLNTNSCSSFEKYENINFIESLDSILCELIPKYLDTDFQLGVALSGGFDSSIIAHYYSKFYTEKERIAFTVNIENQKFSELDLASQYANHLSLPLKIISINNDEHLDYWFEGVSRLDEPNGDSALITTYALFNKCGKYVKGILTGDGGDELFRGYNRHAAQNIIFQKTNFVVGR